MKGTILACLSALFLFSQSALAENEIYQFKNAGSYAYPIYPGLSLDGDITGKIVVDRTSRDTVKLNRLEIVFPNANNLTMTQFEGGSNSFKGISSQGWVFKNIAVHVDLDPFSLNHVSIRGFVVENQNQLNNLDAPTGQMLFDVSAELENVTPNPLADSVSTVFNGKRAYIKLYQNAVLLEQGLDYHFVVDINHLGNGSYRKYLPVAMPVNIKAVAFLLHTINDEQFYSLRVKDENGFESEISHERLDTLLNTYP